MNGLGEQNWYPTSKLGYFTDIVREGISITVGQIELFAPAGAEPYRLDDARVDHAMRAYENQREQQVLFHNQTDHWAGSGRADPGVGCAAAGAGAVASALCVRW
ncbi:hypothetical protein AB4305_24420 [Nocardia sp. 2YAB30]|uniref:hypothetical protein n=1 Tax=Nocardia sp. 2YAB30 TaxID=3233022 RepID=UPI003F9A8D13